MRRFRRLSFCRPGWKLSAGFFSFGWAWGDYDYHFHFLIQYEHWVWGHEVWWYDGDWHFFGFGPLCALAWGWAYDAGGDYIPPVKIEKSSDHDWRKDGF